MGIYLKKVLSNLWYLASIVCHNYSREPLEAIRNMLRHAGRRTALRIKPIGTGCFIEKLYFVRPHPGGVYG